MNPSPRLDPAGASPGRRGRSRPPTDGGRGEGSPGYAAGALLPELGGGGGEWLGHERDEGIGSGGEEG